jgi:hypothetical protein
MCGGMNVHLSWGYEYEEKRIKREKGKRKGNIIVYFFDTQNIKIENR